MRRYGDDEGWRKAVYRNTHWIVGQPVSDNMKEWVEQNQKVIRRQWEAHEENFGDHFTIKKWVWEMWQK